MISTGMRSTGGRERCTGSGRVRTPTIGWPVTGSLFCPDMYNYTVRMASKDEKWLGKGELEFVPFNPDSLQISAVVLGAEPEEGRESPERMGVRFMPRPNTVLEGVSR